MTLLTDEYILNGRGRVSELSEDYTSIVWSLAGGVLLLLAENVPVKAVGMTRVLIISLLFYAVGSGFFIFSLDSEYNSNVVSLISVASVCFFVRACAIASTGLFADGLKIRNSCFIVGDLFLAALVFLLAFSGRYAPFNVLIMTFGTAAVLSSLSLRILSILNGKTSKRHSTLHVTETLYVISMTAFIAFSGFYPQSYVPL